MRFVYIILRPWNQESPGQESHSSAPNIALVQQRQSAGGEATEWLESPSAPCAWLDRLRQGRIGRQEEAGSGEGPGAGQAPEVTIQARAIPSQKPHVLQGPARGAMPPESSQSNDPVPPAGISGMSGVCSFSPSCMRSPALP